MKKEKGSIAIFTLVTLLFMVAFLIISYANIINNSKVLKEQYSTIKGIYYKSNDSSSYTDAYTDLRKKNRQNLTAYVNNSNILELEKAFASKLVNYRIYGNSVQNNTPTPNNPVEIQSLGDKSKNLFNIDNYTIQTVNGFTYAAFDISNLEIGKQYTFSSNPSITWFKISYNIDGYNSVARSDFNEGFMQFTFTMARNENISESTTQYLFIGIGTYEERAATREQLNEYEIQIEEGSDVTDYIPYEKYKIPIEIQTNEKNLFNVDDFIETFNLFKTAAYRTTKEKFDGYDCVKVYGKLNAEGRNIKYLQGKFKTNTQYTFSFDIYNIAQNNYCGIVGYIYYTDGTQICFMGAKDTRKSNIWQRIEVTSDANKSIDYICFTFNAGVAYSYIKNWQIEEGTTATSYEQYKGYATNIYLNEPLRKAGDYADYIDFKNKKIVRKIKTFTFSINDLKYKYVYNDLNGISIPMILESRYTRADGVCNREDKVGKYYYSSGHYMWLGVGNNYIYWVGILDYLGLESVDEFNNWLKDNPTSILYPLEIPVEQEIELPELPTYEDYNKIEIKTEVAPSKIEVEYDGYVI